MDFSKTVRDNVKLADTLTKSLQASVVWEHFVRATGSGDETTTKKTIKAVVVYKQRLIRTMSGELAPSSASVTILDPTVVVSANDHFVLPNGIRSDVLNISGPVDPATGNPFMVEVFLS